MINYCPKEQKVYFYAEKMVYEAAEYSIEGIWFNAYTISRVNCNLYSVNEKPIKLEKPVQ